MKHMLLRTKSTLFLTLATVTILLVAASFASTQTAWADPTLDAEISLLQSQIESSAHDYDQATAKVAALNEAREKNQKRIDQINDQLPGQRQRSVESLRTLYVMQQEGFGLLEMVLASESLTDFLRLVDYIDLITQHNTLQLEKLSSMHDELVATQEQLDHDAHEAEQAAERAQRAMEQAKASRQQAQERALVEAAAQLQRQQEVAQQVAEEQKTAQAAQTSPDTDKGSSGEEPSPTQESAPAGVDAQNTSSPAATAEPEPEAKGTVAAEDVSWQSDRDKFISEWAGRIDAYLAGSPLAGQGSTFAAAAWEYGVDPRWSPAISTVESTKGAYCFLPHNAWGWGSVSWGSWEEAIYAHVGGLARGYGSTLTYESAVKYCPPNANHWYNTCLSEMNKI